MREGYDNNTAGYSEVYRIYISGPLCISWNVINIRRSFTISSI